MNRRKTMIPAIGFLEIDLKLSRERQTNRQT